MVVLLLLPPYRNTRSKLLSYHLIAFSLSSIACNSTNFRNSTTLTQHSTQHLGLQNYAKKNPFFPTHKIERTLRKYCSASNCTAQWGLIIRVIGTRCTRPTNHANTCKSQGRYMRQFSAKEITWFTRMRQTRVSQAAAAQRPAVTTRRSPH